MTQLARAGPSQPLTSLDTALPAGLSDKRPPVNSVSSLGSLEALLHTVFLITPFPDAFALLRQRTRILFRYTDLDCSRGVRPLLVMLATSSISL